MITGQARGYSFLGRVKTKDAMLCLARTFNEGIGKG